jgi:hypothetical protein
MRDAPTEFTIKNNNHENMMIIKWMYVIKLHELLVK